MAASRAERKDGFAAQRGRRWHESPRTVRVDRGPATDNVREVEQFLLAVEHDLAVTRRAGEPAAAWMFQLWVLFQIFAMNRKSKGSMR